MATNDIKYTLNAQLADNPSPRNIAPTGRLCSRPHGAYRKPSTWAKHPQEVATMAEAPKAAAV